MELGLVWVGILILRHGDRGLSVEISLAGFGRIWPDLAGFGRIGVGSCQRGQTVFTQEVRIAAYLQNLEIGARLVNLTTRARSRCQSTS